MVNRFSWNGQLGSKGFLFLILLAAEFLMSFTFLGHVHFPGATLNFAFIPVIVAGCFLGIGQTVAMGFAFGLASSYEASLSYTSPFDRAFSLSISGAPLESFILSVGTRVLFAVLVAVAFDLAKNSSRVRLWSGVVAFLAPLLHAVMVGSMMEVLFPDLAYGVLESLMPTAVDIIVSCSCVVLVEVLFAVFEQETTKRIEVAIDRARLLPSNKSMMPLYILLGTLALLVSAASTFYFTGRMSYTLDVHGMVVSALAERDILHLQAQFFFATLALHFVMVLILVLLHKYHLYGRQLEQMDALTGVMGRKLFMKYCERKQLSGELSDGSAWFLFLDLDHFKRINDTFGHLVGDEVLKEFAITVKNAFSDCGSVGRMGGDEFAAILTAPLTSEELGSKIDRLFEEAAHIFPPAGVISCSVGACRFNCPSDLKSVYAEADKALYVAKEQGRADYVIVELGKGESPSSGHDAPCGSMPLVEREEAERLAREASLREAVEAELAECAPAQADPAEAEEAQCDAVADGLGEAGTPEASEKAEAAEKTE